MAVVPECGSGGFLVGCQLVVVHAKNNLKINDIGLVFIKSIVVSLTY